MPNKGKPNLKVLCEALVHKIITEKKGGNVKAVGVSFEYGGSLYSVNIRQEAILSAG